MQFSRRFQVARFACAHEPAHFRWKQIRSHAHDTNCAYGHKRQCERIVAAQNCKRVGQPAAQLTNALHATACFFDRDDVAAFVSQTLDGLWQDIHAATPWDVVEHDRQRRGAGDCFEMTEKSFLARLVVIWRDEQRGIHSELLGRASYRRWRVAVEFEPVPASTRQRLFAFATATPITCSRSSCESVGDSPVVPIATIPLIPAAICVSISCSNAETSMPPSRNGVTNAVNVPRNIFL